MTEQGDPGPGRGARLSALFENISEAVVEYVFEDGEPVAVAVNEAFEEVFGYPESEVVGEPVDDYIVPPEEADSADRLNEKVVEGEHLQAEVRRRTADGVRTFMIRNAPIDAEEGIRGYAIYADISDRVERERRLTRQNERLAAIFENVPEAIVEYVFEDGEPVAVAVNEAFEEVFGYPESEVVGEPVDDYIVPPEEADSADRLNEKVVEGEHLQAEVRRQTADGVRTFMIRNAPIDTGEEVRGYAIYADITEHVERERKLAEKNERLEEFAGVVSHDLRNPLTVARGYLAGADDDPDAAIPEVERSLDRMEAIIEDVLTLARQGDESVDPERVDLASSAREAWGNVHTDAATLTVAADRSLAADPDCLLQILENLFRNAVEHATDRRGADPSTTEDDPATTEDGPATTGDDPATTGDDPATTGDDPPAVAVSVGTVPDGFYVEDDGRGIDPERREAVFESGYTTAETGTGFGLSIVERLCEAHDWSVVATESDAGGARFEITGVESAP